LQGISFFGLFFGCLAVEKKELIGESGELGGRKMKKTIFSGLIFLTFCIGLNAQTWTAEGNEDGDWEYTVITRQQFERIVRAGETTAVNVILTFKDNIQVTGGGKIIQGQSPNLVGYYYLSAKLIPKSANGRIVAPYISSSVIYGNSNTGMMTLMFMNTAVAGISLRYEWNEYVRQYNQLLELVNGENDYEALFNRGNEYRLNGDYDLAIADYTEALRINPDYYQALYNRGNAYANKGDYDRAIADYTAALRIKPDYDQALNNRGNAYANKGDYDRAIADYTAALRIKPDFDQALYNRGNAYRNKRDYDRAIEDYTAALRINPDYYLALNNRGVAYFDKGDYDHAIEDYTAALRINPDHYPALNNRGNAYRLNGDYDLAIADYTEALRINPDVYQALNNRGIAYYYKGDYDRAIADWEAVLRINPNYPSVRSNIDRARQQRGY